MFFTVNVYLILSEKRLIIVDKKIEDENYVHLHESRSSNLDIAIHCCNCFCAGYLFGNGAIKVINSLKEFN
jgi:hypothetical protein